MYSLFLETNANFFGQSKSNRSASNQRTDFKAGQCQAAFTLQSQIMAKTGNASNFAPYIDYLQVSEETPSIPSTWSSVAKNLLKTIQGPELDPQDMTDLSFFEACVEDEKDPIYEADKLGLETAFTIALTRAWDEKFVPVLDMFNHHPRSNIVTKTMREEEGAPKMIVVFAKYDIDKGYELFTSYRERSRDSSHSVSTLLKEFGFVEDYPQRWVLPTPQKRSNNIQNEVPPEIEFDVWKTGTQSSDRFEVHWINPSEPPTNPVAIDHLKKELTRIHEMNALVEKTAETLVSESERENIVDYYESLIIAYKSVIESIEVAIKYAPAFVEDEGDNFMACADFDAIMEGTYGWFHADESESSHQTIDYHYNDETRDSCLYLDDYLHACVSNRPHYHEVFVHYPAYFLEKVERVLFIGGGDSMVLHEVLKYDDELELVVGLELDQHVVRSTFSHIGTQPHFDNDKVEWWFGDAAEALNVLPTEYYGTFDLVVVDILSEVAEALEVTDDVTIMEAAIMLMKPNGIIVKNEDEGYVPGTTTAREFTNFTADLSYYDVPVYCLQTFVMGSNAIDFSTVTPYDHKISNFYIKGVDEFQSQFDTWYTTGKGNAEEDDSNVDAEKNKNPVSKEKSSTSAMTMIIEVEKISVPMSSIREIIDYCIKTVGFTETKSFQKDIFGGFVLVSVLEEAAISVRCLPEKNYCAIDIQFWKSTHVAESLKKELLSGLKSDENSVFRVISTGVFGVEENDNNEKVGPPTPKSDGVTGHTAQDDAVEPDVETIFHKRSNPEIEFKNATFEDYDSESALAQWTSQEVLGIQIIVRYDIPYDYTLENFKRMIEDLTYDSIEDVSEAFRNTSPEQIMVESFEIGEGLVVVMTWSEGSFVGLWDGKKKFDANIFSLEKSAAASHRSTSIFLRKYLDMKSADIFPRGTGRVISFPGELRGRNGMRRHPFWAPQGRDEPEEETNEVDDYDSEEEDDDNDDEVEDEGEL